MSKYGISDVPRMASIKTVKGWVPNPIYRTWHNLLERVYSPKVKHYEGLSVCDEWLRFSNFLAWAEDKWKGNSLDKDILLEGNKHYSPETCIFVPQWVNTLAISPTRKRDLPLGVYRNGSGFMAQMRVFGVKNSTTIGTYRTPMEAHVAYLTEKARYINELKPNLDAIDERLHPALFNKYKKLYLVTKDKS